MLNKLSSAGLLMALLFSIGGTSAFARNSSGTDPKSEVTTPADPANSTKDAKSREKLRGAMDQLVTEAKAGRLHLAERPQIQPAKSNSLSKTTKIAIGVGIAVAVIAIIVIKHQSDHALDDLRVF